MTITRNVILAAAFGLAAQSAQALTANQLAAQYQNNGYGYIEVRTGVSQIKVEAIKDGQKVEVIYDAATGAILKSETERVGTLGNSDQGPRLRTVGRDFVDGRDVSDDDDDGRDDDNDDDKRNADNGDDEGDDSNDSSDSSDD